MQISAGGTLRFDLPFTASPAGLAQPEIGLHRVVGRAGSATYEIEVTVLDVADHRLIRSGVLLAHRVISGHGDWYLAAPEWQPLLPAERIERLGRGDLPDDLADLVLPFRRRGALGPVAAVSCERRMFELRGGAGDVAGNSASSVANGDGDRLLGTLRDDRVTVRRGGVTTSRYREVQVESASPGLTEQQLAWLVAALRDSGGTQVAAFPDLPERIGTPATGLTDYPRPRPVGADTTFENLVEASLAGGLRDLLTADLSGRTGDVAAGGALLAAATGLRGDLNGLSAALRPDWVAELDEELGWLTTAIEATAEDPERLRMLLRRERYLRLLDALVTAVRAPQLGETAGLSAAETVAGLLEEAVQKLIATAAELEPADASLEAPASARSGPWEAAAMAAEAVDQLSGLAKAVMPKRSRRTAKRLRKAVVPLLEARTAAAAATELQRQSRFVAGVGEAFELGREYQRQTQRLQTAREDFFVAWATAARKLGER